MRSGFLISLTVQLRVFLNVRFMVTLFEELIVIWEYKLVRFYAVLAFRELIAKSATMLSDEDFRGDVKVTSILLAYLFYELRAVVQVLSMVEVVQSRTHVTRLMWDFDPITVQRHNLLDISLIISLRSGKVQGTGRVGPSDTRYMWCTESAFLRFVQWYVGGLRFHFWLRWLTAV